MGSVTYGIPVEGMQDSRCEMKIKEALQSISGVSEVTVDLSEGKVQVSAQRPIRILIDAIQSLGYHIPGH